MKKRTKEAIKAMRESVLDQQINRQISQQMESLNRNFLLRLIYCLRFKESDPWGQERIKRFLKDFVPTITNLTNRYQLGSDSDEWIILRKLKDSGIDVEGLFDDVDVPFKWRIEGETK